MTIIPDCLSGVCSGFFRIGTKIIRKDKPIGGGRSLEISLRFNESKKKIANRS